MKLTHDGLTLWYGTPDAPAPLNEAVDSSSATVVVGVHPAKATNTVHARYRVDGGPTISAAGALLRTDEEHGSQYFIVRFSRLPPGSVVEYAPVLRCAGRQVPAADRPEQLPSTFTVARATAPSAPTGSSQVASRTAGGRLAPDLEFVCSVSIKVDRPIVIGETPEGVRFDFFALDGTVTGPRVNGRVLARSSDHLFVRPDGVAILRVRAMIETNDGALLEVEYTGALDFGPDGYRRAIANDLPTRATYVVSPRYLTSHPRYTWLNRVQCLGVGRIRLDEALVEYDAYAVRVNESGDSSRRA